MNLSNDNLIRGKFPITVTLECSRKQDGTHFHNYTQIWYILSGTLKQNISGKIYTQIPGSFCVIPPFCRHAIDTSESDDTPVYISISFIDSFLTEYGYRYFSFTTPEARFEEHNIPQFETLTGATREIADMLARKLHTEFTKHYEMDYTILRELLVEFIRILCRKELIKEDVTLSKERAEAVSKAINYIEKHYNEKITIDKLCQISAMSRRVFTNTFKAVTGLTVVEFVNGYRIIKARNKILFSNQSLSEIAQSIGVYDKAYLSRLFNKYYGLSPTEYRAEQQKFALIMDKEQASRWDWINNEEDIEKKGKK